MVDNRSADFQKTASMHLRIESSLSTTPLFRTKAFLNQKYVVEKLPARQIAVLIGCGHSTINSALKRYGLAAEPRESGWLQYGTKLENGIRVQHVREQMTIDSIRSKRKTGWSYQKINLWLHGRGIKCPSGRAR